MSDNEKETSFDNEETANVPGDFDTADQPRAVDISQCFSEGERDPGEDADDERGQELGGKQTGNCLQFDWEDEDPKDNMALPIPQQQESVWKT